MHPQLEGDTRELDAFVERLQRAQQDRVRLPDLASIRQSGPFVSVQRFYETSFQILRELLYFTSLKPEHRVLDYGCGLARLAISLSGFLDPRRGSYCGVDVNRTVIERNRDVFGELGNFRFEHVDLHNRMYNRRGGPFERLLAADFGGPFDLIAMFSVFTHVLPEHLDVLLDFLRTQLAGRGELFSTWFLLNPETQECIRSGKTHRRFETPHGAARIDNPDVPEGAVAYEEADVLRRLRLAGLEPIRVYYGEWRGAGPTGVWQDVIVAKPVG